jgi:nucleoside-diphosphate-sugar epimerase
MRVYPTERLFIMRIVIVGGTGNISISIVELLLSQGHEVTCYNRGLKGTVPPGARLITGDRKHRAEFEATMQREQFDVAIDMICFDKADAESDIRAFRGVQQFVQCSSVMSYGKPDAWLPVTEDHPLQPDTPYGVGKAEADHAFMAAFYSENFPVTIIKPSTTHGPIRGLVRQVSRDTQWIDRVRKGKPLVVCGDGRQMIQFLHVKDAAPGFVGVIGKSRCIGQTYNLVEDRFTYWDVFHHTAMEVIGREVDLVGVPLHDLLALDVPNMGTCKDVYSYNNYFSSEKIMRDVPEFRPQMTLREAMVDIIAAMDAEGRIDDSDNFAWEDQVIAAQRRVRETKIN